MQKSILNVITQLLAYRPNVGVTDNPNQRHFDWTRKFYALEVTNPDSDQTVVPPGGAYTLFDGSEVNPLDTTSVLAINTIPQAGASRYRLSVTAGTSGFRTPRVITGLGTFASLVVQDLTYTAVPGGDAGNAVTVAYTVVAAWDVGTTYQQGAIVSYSGQNYSSLTNSNTGNEPDTSPASWQVTTAGTAGFEVVSVLGTAVSVLMASGASTATDIQTAVQASLAASALVTVTVSGTGSNPQTGPTGPTNLAGAQFTTVTINNNAVATFDFGSATIGATQPGDILRISGVATFDGSGPFGFNPANAGFWQVLSVSGSVITAARLPGQQFVGVSESAPSQPSDVQIYTAAGIQVGDKFAVSGSFNPITNGTYVISAVTPTSLDFFSSAALPIQSGVAYVLSTIQFYTASQRLVYIEADQPGAVQFNADVSNNVLVTPIVPGDPGKVGYLHKWGDSYKCVVQNTSVYPMTLRWFIGE